MRIKRVTKKSRKIATDRANALIADVREILKSDYKFSHRLVGSAKFNTILKDSEGKYDIDYQFVITKNSKKFNLMPKDIKDDFVQAFADSINENEKLENSTTAITIRYFDGGKEQFSFDFVIIKEYNDPKEIIRRNGRNQYTWNMLPSRSDDTYTYLL